MALEYHQLEISAIDKTAKDAVCITFRLPEALVDTFKFTPGQHLTLRRTIDGKSLRRFYSICSAKSGQDLKIAVRKIKDGQFSGYLNHDAAVGDTIEVLAPRGRFCLEDNSIGKSILAFAAGSGITPVFSIIASHLEEDLDANATLIYGNRHTDTIMLREQINDLKDRYLDRFQIIYLLSREQQDKEQFNGHINKETIDRLEEGGLINPVGADQILICGPTNMITNVEQAIIDLGASPEKVSNERFTGNDSATAVISEQTKKAVEAGARVSFMLDGIEKEFIITNSQDTVLVAAEKSGIELPFSCAGGMCATCRCKLLEGDVEMAQNYALEPWELEKGYVLACQSRPTTEKIYLDFDAG